MVPQCPGQPPLVPTLDAHAAKIGSARRMGLGARLNELLKYNYTFATKTPNLANGTRLPIKSYLPQLKSPTLSPLV